MTNDIIKLQKEIFRNVNQDDMSKLQKEVWSQPAEEIITEAMKDEIIGSPIDDEQNFIKEYQKDEYIEWKKG